MQISEIVQRKKNNSKGVLLGLALLIMAALAFWAFKPSGIEAKQLWIAEVQRGDLNISEKGFGRLKPKHQRMLTSPVEAVVEEIFSFPGSELKPQQVIMRLSNPELERALAHARFELQSEQSQLKELEISSTDILLNQELQISQVKSQVEVAKLRVAALQNLFDSGIVSKIDLQGSTIELAQLEHKLEIENKRLAILKNGQQQKFQIEKDRVGQTHQRIAMLEEQLDKLNVKAGIAGVLQTMDVELGQSVTIGQRLAQIGSSDVLLAELKISQRNAAKVAIGQKVKINTYSDFIDGVVTRKDPVVDDGRITIDVDLLGTLPDSAIAQLSIEGEVFIDSLKNVTYVESGPKLKQNVVNSLFIVDKDAGKAIRRQVKLGAVSGPYIHIESGVKAGQQLVLGGLTDEQGSEQLSINF